MSRITENYTDATTYARVKVIETGNTYKLYYRRYDRQYIVASPGSDVPRACKYLGEFSTQDGKVIWVSAHGTNDITRMG